MFNIVFLKNDLTRYASLGKTYFTFLENAKRAL